MKVCIYRGGLALVQKSGVGRAVQHQQQALRLAGVPLCATLPWKRLFPAARRREHCVVHINTVLPSAVLAALRAKLLGCKVVYYGHSTMEDFRNSFACSNLLAPLFKRWLLLCYSLGDIIITPSEYSRRILLGYGLKQPVYALSNGVDTDFFCPDPAAGQRFRARYGLSDSEPCVISVGHWMVRKGLPDFVALARRFPSVRFFWFGHTDTPLLTEEVRAAMAAAPPNLIFAGYADAAQLRDAYCGADCFAFLSHEETEGIVVLEALACGCPVLLRDIPVYQGWLENGVSVYKGQSLEAFAALLGKILDGSLPPLQSGGRAVTDARSLARIGAALQAIYRKENWI